MTYIIVDFEATCCNDSAFPREEMEIIEIGAVALQGNGPEIQDEFQSFIQPVRNPVLTEFCTELTSITQQQVSDADLFEPVMTRFSVWIERFPNPIFCSWGNFDRAQLRRDCEFHSVSYPFSDHHINIKQVFSDNRGLKRGLGVQRALRTVGLEFEGTAHRGIDDARNMARLSNYLFDR